MHIPNQEWFICLYQSVFTSDFRGDIRSKDNRVMYKFRYRRAPFTIKRFVLGILASLMAVAATVLLADLTGIAALVFLSLPILILVIWLTYRGWEPVPIEFFHGKDETPCFSLRQKQLIAFMDCTWMCQTQGEPLEGSIDSSYQKEHAIFSAPDGSKVKAKKLRSWRETQDCNLLVDDQLIGECKMNKEGNLMKMLGFSAKGSVFKLVWDDSKTSLSKEQILVLATSVVLIP